MCTAIHERLVHDTEIATAAPQDSPTKMGRRGYVPCAFAVLAVAALLVPRTARAEETDEADLSLLYHGEVPDDLYPGYGTTGRDIEVPSNGALLVEVACAEDCDSEPEDIELHVVDAEGQELDGEIVDGRLSDGSGWVGWKPTGGFVRDEIFRLSDHSEMSLGPVLSQVQFRATEATESTAPPREVLVRAKVVQLDYQGRYHCCSELDPEADEAEKCSFIATDAVESVSVYLALGPNPPTLTDCPDLVVPEPLVAPQHVYFVRPTSDTSPTEDAEWTAETEWVLNFPVQDEYCFEVLARHVATGTETIVESRCDGNERIEFPYVPRSIQMHNAGAFAACTVPPAGQEHHWCSTYAEAVRDQSCEGYNKAACQAALASCPPSGSDLGAGGAGGAIGDGGAGFVDDTVVDAGMGCSVAAASGPGTTSFWQVVSWMLSAMGVFGLIWRRRLGTLELQRARVRSTRTTGA